MMSVQQLSDCLQNAELKGGGDRQLQWLTTDSRSACEGALFVALRGERFDGHDFIAEAAAHGAAAALVEHWCASDLPMIKVADTRMALAQIAAHWRRQWSLPVVAVAGSNGKTTVTQMIASIFRAAVGDSAYLATHGNLNNEIGVPLMVSRLTAQHRLAVFELGMNHVGEMAHLAAIAQANIALITNAQREHQEFMQSVAATAEENAAVLDALPSNGTAIFPIDDACTPIWQQRLHGQRMLRFGFDAAAEVSAKYQLTDHAAEVNAMTPLGVLPFRLNLSGVHNVRNALAATAAAIAAGVDGDAIVRGLQSFSPVAGRGTRLQTAGGAVLIDESYNANPDSVLAAIDTLALHEGLRCLILGDMGETGDQSAQFHTEVGDYARQKRIQHVLAIGEASRLAVAAFNQHGNTGARHFTDYLALIEAARQLAQSPEAVLLVKGSRFMKMEQVIQALRV